MTDPEPDDPMRKHEEWLRTHPQLDPEEHKIVLEVVDAWRGMRALSRILRRVVFGLGALAALFAVWDQLVAKLRSLLAP